MTVEALPMPREVIWRRLHSLTGLWFVLFLVEHLFTNSQAALFFGDDGMWFVRSVNFIHNLPYLQVIEVVLLGIPIAYHAILGIRYCFSAKPNVAGGRSKRPRMSTGRNWAYTFQRLTSWILLIGLVLHVWYMRFYTYPTIVHEGKHTYYFATYKVDSGIYSVADRLGVKLYDREEIEREKALFSKQMPRMDLVRQKLRSIEDDSNYSKDIYNREVDSVHQSWQHFQDRLHYLEGLESKRINESEVVGVSENFGNIILLTVRDAFKSVTKAILYTIYVAAACFHAFNGLWTFMITWGLMLNMRSHAKMVGVSVALMLLFGFLGVMAIWGTYWINLKN